MNYGANIGIHIQPKNDVYLFVLFLCDCNSSNIFLISFLLDSFNPLPQLYCFRMSSNGPLCLDIKIVLNKLHLTLLSSFILIILLNLAIKSANSQLLQSAIIQHFSYIGYRRITPFCVSMSKNFSNSSRALPT